jgi:hypothetical protein
MIMPFLIDAIADAPPGLAILVLNVILWTAVIGAGSIVWDTLR